MGTCLTTGTPWEFKGVALLLRRMITETVDIMEVVVGVWFQLVVGSKE